MKEKKGRKGEGGWEVGKRKDHLILGSLNSACYGGGMGLLQEADHVGIIWAQSNYMTLNNAFSNIDNSSQIVTECQTIQF